VALELGGSLKGFGGPTLKDGLRHQIGELVKNIERESESGPSADGPPAGPPS
jgi:hypothetical protein